MLNLAEVQQTVNPEFVTIDDGVHYNPEFQEYEIVINGDAVAWAATQSQAWRTYSEMLRVNADHVTRNPANFDHPAAPLAIDDPQPADPTPLDEAVDGLRLEYKDHPRRKELYQRIAAAAALVREGRTEFPKYQTEFDPSGYYGLYSCNCPDAQYRNLRANFGVACKHALAMELSRRIRQQQDALAQRKLHDMVERLPRISHAAAEQLAAEIEQDAPAVDDIPFDGSSAPLPAADFGTGLVAGVDF